MIELMARAYSVKDALTLGNFLHFLAETADAPGAIWNGSSYEALLDGICDAMDEVVHSSGVVIDSPSEAYRSVAMSVLAAKFAYVEERSMERGRIEHEKLQAESDDFSEFDDEDEGDETASEGSSPDPKPKKKMSQKKNA